MAKAKRKQQTKENVSGSVQEIARATEGRRRSERRVGSGNTRSGAIAAKKAAAKLGR